jgi:hypothetical protein
MVNVSTWVSIQPKTNEHLDRITGFKGASITPEIRITEVMASSTRVD